MSKTKVAQVPTKSLKTKYYSELRGHLGLGQWVSNLVGTIMDATVRSGNLVVPKGGLQRMYCLLI